MPLTPQQRDDRRFYAELTVILLRSLMFLGMLIYLVLAIVDLHTTAVRAGIAHDAMMKQHLDALKELDTSRHEHRAIWQRLAR
jgi:hypothetical protein